MAELKAHHVVAMLKSKQEAEAAVKDQREKRKLETGNTFVPIKARLGARPKTALP